MIVLCLIRVNVYLSIILSGLLCALLGGLSLPEGMTLFISGMGNNAETVFSLLLFGILAVSMTKTGVGEVLAPRVTKLIGNRVWVLVIALGIIAIITETFVLVYVAFVPIMIPPLLKVFNKYKVDRRMLVTVIVSGFQIGYVCVPAGYGLIFQGIVQNDLATNGLEVSQNQIIQSNLVLALAMIISAAIAIFVYRKPREYEDRSAVVALASEDGELPKIEWKHIAVILSGLVAVVVQSATESMALGALSAVAAVLITGAIKWKDFDTVTMEGIASMSLVCFVLLVAGGFATVSREVGQLDVLVASLVTLIGGNKLLGAFVMLCLGLLVTMGIGSAWGTIPIIATVLVPMGLQLGFSTSSIIMLVSAAACLGDAGSPSSDQTLVPTAGFNVDGQHDHIRDTCIPTFLCINIPLILVATVSALFL